MDRNDYRQGCAAGKGCVGDDGGHLIASSLGGVGDGINLAPQAATLNRKEWRAMEVMLQKEIQAGSKVTIDIKIGYPAGGTSRPNNFLATADINGKIREFPFEQ